MKQTLLFFFLLSLSVLSVAQSGDAVKLRLADEFFANKEFDKSISLYEEVFKKNQSKEVYLSLFNAYLAVEDYTQAEKLVRKQLKKAERDPVFQVDYGYVLIRSGEEKKGQATPAEQPVPFGSSRIR